LTTVGWLTRDSRFETGSAPEPFFRKLSQLCVMPWQPDGRRRPSCLRLVPVRWAEVLRQSVRSIFRPNLRDPDRDHSLRRGALVPSAANLYRCGTGLLADWQHGLQEGAAVKWWPQSGAGGECTEPTRWPRIGSMRRAPLTFSSGR